MFMLIQFVKNRQLTVRNEAPEVDLVLVVGSKNSSNSLRLTEIASTVGTPSFLIDDVSMIQDDWFSNVENVLITAGASAPEHLVAELVDYLVQQFNGELVNESLVEEGMYFSKPRSLAQYLQHKNVTIEGNNQ